MTSIFEGQPPPPKEAFSNKSKGHLGSRYIKRCCGISTFLCPQHIFENFQLPACYSKFEVGEFLWFQNAKLYRMRFLLVCRSHTLSLGTKCRGGPRTQTT